VKTGRDLKHLEPSFFRSFQSFGPFLRIENHIRFRSYKPLDEFSTIIDIFLSLFPSFSEKKALLITSKKGGKEEKMSCLVLTG
jgi:hypothetical protein